VARSYDISLLPSLQEQAEFLKQNTQELVRFCENEYGAFLALVDAESLKNKDNDVRQNLEDIYGYASARLEALQDMMAEEMQGIEDWEKMLKRVEETGDQGLWQDVSSEMIEDGDFKTTTAEFNAWVIEQMTSLKKGVVEVLGDWSASIEEGETENLARFMEALEEMEDEESEGQECCDSDEECGSECDDEGDECCGRQTPCCRGSEEQEDLDEEA